MDTHLEHEYQYNDNGEVISDKQHYIDDYNETTSDCEYRYDYEYTEDGKISKQISHYYDSEGSHLVDSEIWYEYDNNGRVIKTYNPTMGSNDYTEYEYDESGNLIKEM